MPPFSSAAPCSTAAGGYASLDEFWAEVPPPTSTVKHSHVLEQSPQVDFPEPTLGHVAVSNRKNAWRNKLDLLLVSGFRLLDRDNIGSLNIGELDIEAKAQMLSRVLGQGDLLHICRLHVGQWLTLCNEDDVKLPPPPPTMDLRTARIVMFGDSLLTCYGARTVQSWGQLLKDYRNID